jgi:hypothetical protein
VPQVQKSGEVAKVIEPSSPRPGAKPAAINRPRPRSALLKATEQQRHPQRVPEKWLWHYRALVGLRHRLVRERKAPLPMWPSRLNGIT